MERRRLPPFGDDDVVGAELPEVLYISFAACGLGGSTIADAWRAAGSGQLDSIESMLGSFRAVGMGRARGLSRREVHGRHSPHLWRALGPSASETHSHRQR